MLHQSVGVRTTYLYLPLNSNVPHCNTGHQALEFSLQITEGRWHQHLVVHGEVRYPVTHRRFVKRGTTDTWAHHQGYLAKRSWDSVVRCSHDWC